MEGRKVFVNLMKKIVVRKFGSADGSRSELDFFEGEALEEEPGSPYISVKTADYGVLSFGWANIAGVQWEPFKPLGKPKGQNP